MKLKEEFNVPLIITAHGYDIYSLPFKNNKWMRRIQKVLNKADKIITVSKSNIDYIEKLDVKTDVTLIPNGFSPDIFFPIEKDQARRNLNIPLNKYVIVSIGNLIKNKGHKFLVDAINIIKKTSDLDIICFIIGGGILKKKLKKQIKRLGLSDNIFLKDYRPYSEIPIWMNSADLFVLPSIQESFGVVVLESLACGTPVVATRNGGSEEVLTSKELGLLCEVGNSSNLAKYIEQALEKDWDKKRLVKYAEKFSWEKISEDLFYIYQEVLD